MIPFVKRKPAASPPDKVSLKNKFELLNDTDDDDVEKNVEIVAENEPQIDKMIQYNMLSDKLTDDLAQLFALEWGDDKIQLASQIFQTVNNLICAGFDWNSIPNKQHLVNYFHVAIHMVKYTNNTTQLTAQLEQQMSDILSYIQYEQNGKEWSNLLSQPDAWDNRNVLLECLLQNHLSARLIPILILKFRVNVLFSGGIDLHTQTSKNENCCFMITIKLLNLIKKYVTKFDEFSDEDKKQLDSSFSKWIALFESINKRTDIDFDLKVMLLNTKDTRGYTALSLLKHNREHLKQHVFADQMYECLHTWLTKQQYSLIRCE
jgi:hypothetical protein